MVNQRIKTMKYFTKKAMLIVFLTALISTGCSNDDDNVNTNPNLESKTYQLFEVANSGVSGTATFTNRTDGSVLISLELNGTPQNGMHPSHIHFNTAAEGGAIALNLNPVEGATGISETIVTQFADGMSLSYQDLLEFDGYINVHLSMDDLATILAQGDIGQNELTGMSKTYTLGEKDVPGINGSVIFEERINGEALATVMLEGTPEGGMHPTHIHMNTAAEGGPILYTFNPVNGSTGMSFSNVASLDDNTAFGYQDILNVDGYINVHLSMDELATIVAQGDIGQNELTGMSKTYTLGEKDVPGISGSVVFEERINGEALATVMLEGTPEGGMHPTHIHMNSAAEGGPILYTFNPVNGTTGISRSNLSSLDDNTSFGYNDVLSVDGYINIHLSMEVLETIVAQGDIGSNAM